MSGTLDPVTALRRAHPAWQISCASGVWQAVCRPAQNSEHILVGPSIEELAAKLEQAEEP